MKAVKQKPAAPETPDAEMVALRDAVRLLTKERDDALSDAFCLKNLVTKQRESIDAKQEGLELAIAQRKTADAARAEAVKEADDLRKEVAYLTNFTNCLIDEVDMLKHKLRQAEAEWQADKERIDKFMDDLEAVKDAGAKCIDGAYMLATQIAAGIVTQVVRELAKPTGSNDAD